MNNAMIAEQVIKRKPAMTTKKYKLVAPLAVITSALTSPCRPAKTVTSPTKKIAIGKIICALLFLINILYQTKKIWQEKILFDNIDQR